MTKEKNRADAGGQGEPYYAGGIWKVIQRELVNEPYGYLRKEHSRSESAKVGACSFENSRMAV